MPRILLTACILALLYAPAPRADDTAAAALIELLSPIQSLRADFEQRVIDTDGSELQRSSGDMFVARGNRFRWNTKTPWPQQLVSNGNTLWQYDVDLEQVVERRFDARMSETPALLLAGDITAIETQYEITALPVETPGASRFVLKPRDAESVFVSLELHFEDDQPVQISLTDGFGQRTELRFRNAQRNAPTDDALFELQLPPGVDVLSDGN